MVPAPFVVVLDANVLFPFTLRDTLLRAAAAGFYQLRWSARILDETTMNLVATGTMTQERALRLRGVMERAFPEAEVTGFEPLIASMPNDEKDRHVTAAAVKAGAQVARARFAAPEEYQTLREDRLWADLLSSMPLCFNLFGELAGDPVVAQHALRSWWPDTPTGSVSVRFEHSPGRRDPGFLGNRSAFDVAFEGDAGSGSRAIVGVETKYHEHAAIEAPPRPPALARYQHVTERSGAFVEGWRERIVGTDLQQIWLDHLLVLAMLEHASRQWTWGRLVLVYPASNPSFAAAASRYRDILVDRSTFDAVTIEHLVGVPGALPDEVLQALRERYLFEAGGPSEQCRSVT